MDSLSQYVAAATLCTIIIGCLGNLLSLVIFLQHSSSVNTLLAALSFVDLCLLLFAVPVFVLPNLVSWVESSTQQAYYTYVLNFVYPVNLMMQTCSIYIMVLITMERWTAVCRPLQVRIWCSPQTSRKALLGIVLFAIIYNIVRFWEYSMIVTPEGLAYARHLRDFHSHPHYMIGYYTALFLLTHFLIPFGVIIVLNGHVCKSIIALRRARLMLTRQQQREQSTTMMLLVVTLVFALCNTLPFLLNLAECFKNDLFSDESTAWMAFQLNDLSNLLVVFNSSTTFLVYLAFSAKYRSSACIYLLGNCWGSYEKDVKYNSLQSRTHSIRANSSFCRQDSYRVKYSSSQELFLRPLSRSERAASEYNERIKRAPTASRLTPPASCPQSSRKQVTASGTAGRPATPADAHLQVKPSRQQSHPGQSPPVVIEHRRMSDNPSIHSRVPTPTPTPTASTRTESPVSSVIVTVLSDDSATATVTSTAATPTTTDSLK